MTAYFALIHKDEESSYGVSFPDFPGCITGGSTLDEAVRDASDALGFHIRGMIKDGEVIPTPTPLERIVGLEEAQDASATFLVTPNMAPKGKAVRLNITMDEYLVNQIDAYVAHRGKSRSAFLADAAREAMLV